MKREEIDKMLHDKVESGEKVSPILLVELRII